MQHERRHEGDAGDPDRQAPAGGRAGGWRGGGATRRLGAMAVVAVYAWWAVGLEPFSTGATVAVVLAGAVAMAVGAWSPPPPPPRRADMADVAVGTDRRAGVAGWVVLGALAGAWQLAAYVQDPRADHPTLSSLTNELLDSRAARTAAFVLWIAAARALARR